MPKDSIKEHLDGNELDLSLSNMTSLPVKELAVIPKATHLDFSNNSLTTVPQEFCTLSHIVKLDLSKNQISSLPSNFGHLQKLQTLDLYSNQLTTLPVSMCHLKSLKWLDVKNNPLNEQLLSVTGDCLDDTQCKKCAHSVVAFMKKVESEQEKRRQKALQEERAKEAARKAEEEQERQKKRAERKAEKERKKRELEARKAAEKESEIDESLTSQEPEEEVIKENGLGTTPKMKKKSGLSCCGVFLSAILGLLAIILGLYFYCISNPNDASCGRGRDMALQYYEMAQKKVKEFTSQ